jgi:hypothetical protein
LLEQEEVTDTDLDGDRIHQGDIIRWERPDGTEWTQYGIVVTADCDLAHYKTRGRISYVPVVRLATYVHRFWGPDYVAKRVTKTFEGAVAAIRRAHHEHGFTGDLTETAIADWIGRDEPPMIAAALLNSDCDPKDRRRFEFKVAAARSAMECERRLAMMTTEEGHLYLEQLTSSFRQIAPEIKGDPAEIVSNAFEGHCSSLPGDVFFVSQIPGDGDVGFFALLRHVSQCEHLDISLDSFQRAGPTLPFRRVARLCSPYVYALTQNLARVFADIGLPQSHPARLDASVKKFLCRGEAK